jgi:hypothetical protein
MFSNKNQQKNSYTFCCEKCHFETNKKCNYDDHLLTRKHKRAMISNTNQQKPASKHFCENCYKEYKDYSGLWRHKKKCLATSLAKENETDDETNDKIDEIDGINIKDKDALIMYVLKQNSDLQRSLIEMSKEKSHINHNNSHNTNNNHSHNKTFNLQFFLNETCKDALNISDFVQTIKPSLEDLENTGRLGYIEGISSIILKNLKKLEHHNRPIHCSDSKREVMYIKDNNEWIKESDHDKPILTKAIKVIAHENIKKISDWRTLNPDCSNADSKKNNLYLKIVSNSMSGSTKEESDKNLNRIISNVAKETIIEKDNGGLNVL